MTPGMSQSQGMHLQQSLSPQMQQSLQILQAPMMELREMIALELAQNPVLEEESNGWTLADTSVPVEAGEGREETWSRYLAQSGTAGGGVDDEERHRFLLDSLSRAPTIREAILEQLAILSLSEEERRIAEAVAGNVGPDGLLGASLSEIAFHEKTTPLRVEEVLEKIQRVLEPAGLAARDLRECLLLQLERRGRTGSTAAKIITKFFAEAARRHFAAIAKALGISQDEVEEAVGEIASLDPNPARSFSSEPEIGIVPEVIVEEDGESFVVSLNSEELPRLRVNDTYKDLLGTAAGADHREVREYLRERLRNGKSFIRSLEQRNETLLAIAREIVARQEDFLRMGARFLRPMRMADVAAALGVHETTISRAVSGKHLRCPQGVFDLKFFFSSGYTSEGGESVSNEGVRKLIGRMIAEESPQKPISDEAIAGRLADAGLKVARRTIAKYREKMGILPSHLRKNSFGSSRNVP